MSNHLHFSDEKFDERFWAKVQITDACWLWTAHCIPVGYGVIGIDGIPNYAHRLMYELYHGPIPKGMFVLHSCDVRKCCNPDHLRLGTAADNTRDMYSKGRQRPCRGEKIGNSKLTESQVLEIRKLWSEGNITQIEISKKFGVDPSWISRIVRHEFWRHANETLQTLR